MDKINLVEKLARFTDHWHPHIIGDLNEHHIKLAKLQGDFIADFSVEKSRFATSGLNPLLL